VKKNTVLSVISILVCFLIGYAVFQATNLISAWILDSLSECKSVPERRCTGDRERPVVHQKGPQNLIPSD
jgi:hypothetical protein